jgi:site-specific recombinase XerD
VKLFDVLRHFGDLFAEADEDDEESAVKARPVLRPGSRGGHFHYTRTGQVDYGPLPTGERRVSRRADLLRVRDRHLREFLQTHLSEQTIRAYRADLENFFGVGIEDLTVEKIRHTNLEDVLAYRDRLLRSQQPATVARKLTTLRNLFQYLVEMKLMEDNPARKRLAKAPRVSTVSTTHGLSEAEAKKLLAGPDRTTLVGKRDAALLYLLLTTGLRRDEIPGLRYESIRLLEDGGADLLVEGKGGSRREVYVKPSVLAALREYIAARGWRAGPLFSAHASREPLTAEGVRYVLAGYFEKAGLTVDAEGRPRKLSPHSLRHTAATLALTHGAPPMEVQKMLGHADLRTTYRYLRDPKVRAAQHIPL